MYRNKLIALLASLMLMQTTSCTPIRKEEPLDNGIYFWKTVFQLDDWERVFLNGHGIKRIYVRLFDVDFDSEHDMPVPIATIRFEDEIPEGVEIVPVVYITEHTLKDGGINKYDSALYKRVLAMAKRNGFGSIREIQLDCDWTATTESNYFAFCQSIRNMAANDGISVSATIRLHQLKSAIPPVDRGVLMLYNTGSLYNTQTSNSILDYKDVEPYLRNVSAYGIPLSFAFPTYGWGILMRDDEFRGILHHTDFSDRTYFTNEGDNHYCVNMFMEMGKADLYPGDIVRLEIPEIKTIRTVKELAEKRLGRPSSNIIYHLDSANLVRYTSEEINTILE